MHKKERSDGHLDLSDNTTEGDGTDQNFMRQEKKQKV